MKRMEQCMGEKGSNNVQGHACMQDRRKEMAKLVSKLGEDGKVAIR